MATEIEQHIALGLVNDELMVFSDLAGSRGRMKGERKSDEHPFIKFANAKNLQELLIAVDELYDLYGHLPFIRDLEGQIKPKPVDPRMAQEVARIFDEHPTRTTVEKTREAMGVWYFDDMRPSDDAQMNADLNDGRVIYSCTPLNDLFEAKEDLRRTSMLMAWLVGKCSFERAHGCTPGDRDARFTTIDMVKGECLSGYYERLRKNFRNPIVDLNLHSTTYLLHLYDEKSIESTVSGYVQAAFTLLMSDVTKCMDMYMRPYTYVHTILSAAWSFFAEGLDKEDGAGSIKVCEHCGRFFQPKRSTKVFCDNSCRVGYLREHPGEQRSERVETQTARMRRERREREQSSKF